MKKRTISNNLIMAGLFVCFVAAAIIIIVTTKQPKGENPIDATLTSSMDQNTPPANPPAAQPSRPQPALPTAKIKLSDVVETAKSWMPEFDLYSNKLAPDLTLTDLEGQQHQLSQYRGKPVILVVWTPKGSSKLQLKALQDLKDAGVAPDLQILALSYQMDFPPVNADTIRQYALANPDITFPMCVAASDSLPSPFSQVDSAPCSFFITPEGRIKIVALGLVPQDDIKSLLAAR